MDQQPNRAPFVQGPNESPVTYPIDWDGEVVQLKAGENLAIGLIRSKGFLFARGGKYHRPRGPTCLKGECEGCLLRIDGEPNVMACRKTVTGPLRIETQNVVGTRQVDLLSAANVVFRKGLDHHHLLSRPQWLNNLVLHGVRLAAGVGELPSEPEVQADAQLMPALKQFQSPVVVVGGNGLRSHLGPNCLHVTRNPDDAIGPSLSAEVVALYRTGSSFVLVGVGSESEPIEIHADKVVLDLGLRYNLPWIPGADLPGVIGPSTHNTLADQGVAFDTLFVGQLVSQSNASGVLSLSDVLEIKGCSPKLRVVTTRGTLKTEVVVLPELPSSRYELAAQVGAEVKWFKADGGEGYFDVVTDDISMTNVTGLFWLSPFVHPDEAQLDRLALSLSSAPPTEPVPHE